MRQVAGVGLFVDHDSKVGAELPRELAVADVDGMDLGGAVGEQDICEAAGGGADVEADAVFRGKGEVGQGMLELEAASGDPGVVLAADFQREVLG